MTALTSEDAILSVIERHFPRAHSRLLMGRGDDCCVLESAGKLAISTDLFMEDVHFRRSYFTPEDIGWKALAVNISDLAAGGARPVGFSLGLALPPEAGMELVDRLFAGMAMLAAPLNLALTGGDLSGAEKLHLCITVFGDVTPGGMLRRANCRPGDIVFLIGELGLARTGLAALEADGRAALERCPVACQAHLRPVPHTSAGLALAALQEESGKRLSLMDVSDGLARDLPRLLGSFGAALELPAPCREIFTMTKNVQTGEMDPDRAWQTVWLGGEDYALLGTCEPDLLPALHHAVPDARPLGQVTEGPITWNGREASRSDGFDHFARA